MFSDIVLLQLTAQKNNIALKIVKGALNSQLNQRERLNPQKSCILLSSLRYKNSLKEQFIQYLYQALEFGISRIPRPRYNNIEYRSYNLICIRTRDQSLAYSEIITGFLYSIEDSVYIVALIYYSIIISAFTEDITVQYTIASTIDIVTTVSQVSPLYLYSRVLLLLQYITKESESKCYQSYLLTIRYINLYTLVKKGYSFPTNRPYDIYEIKFIQTKRNQRKTLARRALL